MATNSMAISHGAEATSFWQGAVVVLGRFFYVLLFLMAGPSTFSKQTIAIALSRRAFASIAVPLSGVLALAGGFFLSIFAGLSRKNLAPWLHCALPGSGNPHDAKFWAVQDPMMAQMHMGMFMKNVAMLGSALLISQFGSRTVPALTPGARAERV